MVKVKFTTDFAIKRVGDVIVCDSQMASCLVNIDKVAVYTDEDVTQVESNREYIELGLNIENLEVIAEVIIPEEIDVPKEKLVNIDKVAVKTSKNTK